jgi:hypothetical protein
MLIIAIVRWVYFFDSYAFATVRVVGTFSNQQDAEAYLLREGFKYHEWNLERGAGWRKELSDIAYEACYFRILEKAPPPCDCDERK